MEDLELDYIPYEDAKELKRFGFKRNCIKGFYNKEEIFASPTNPIDFNSKKASGEFVSCPTFSQAFRWFRKKHNIVHTVYSTASGFMWELHYDTERGGTHIKDSDESGDCEMSGTFTSYEKAELACLRELINYKKNKNENN